MSTLKLSDKHLIKSILGEGGGVGGLDVVIYSLLFLRHQLTVYSSLGAPSCPSCE